MACAVALTGEQIGPIKNNDAANDAPADTAARGQPTLAWFQRHTDFMIWGDQRVLAAALAVVPDEYYRARGFSHGSLHAILVHAMAAQWTWLTRWNGDNVSRLEDAADYPTRESLTARWPAVHAAVRTFVAGRTPRDLAAPLTYRNTRGETFTLPLGELIMHCLDHGTYHRGQTNSMIKLAGGTPVMVNYCSFVSALQPHGGPPAGPTAGR